MVKKPNGTWRMCVDYTDLNKACPMDEYPLPRIDQIVDSTSGCELLCFLDAYLGYHQISMRIDDEEKTAFATPFGVYCYIKMPFSLKNAGSMYQKCVHIVVEGHIGHNVKAYIDDIIVKSKFKGDLIANLEETFNNLPKNKMMLNLDKCSFGISSGKLLVYLVSHRGIEANSKKVKAINDMQFPRNKKEVQKLAGMAALSRFVSKSGK
jgi:hypothetical protein